MHISELDLLADSFIDISHRRVHEARIGRGLPQMPLSEKEQSYFDLAVAAELTEGALVGFADRYGVIRACTAPVVLLEKLLASQGLVDMFSGRAKQVAIALMPEWLNLEADKDFDVEAELTKIKQLELAHIDYLTPVIERVAMAVKAERTNHFIDPVRYGMRSARLDTLPLAFAVEMAVLDGYSRNLDELKCKLNC